MRISRLLRTTIVALASLCAALVFSILCWLLLISWGDMYGNGLLVAAIAILIIVFPTALGIFWFLTDEIAEKLTSKLREIDRQPTGA